MAKRKTNGKLKAKTVVPDDHRQFGLDSEDEFYEGRDKIMLAGDGNHRRDEEMEPSDEEVLGLETNENEPGSMEDESSEEEDDDNDESDEVPDDAEDAQPYTNWGKGRSGYYGADEIQNEEDQELLQKELDRFREERYQNRRDEDYETANWLEDGKPDNDSKSFPKSQTQKLIIKNVSDLPESEQQRLVDAYFPELERLQAEFATLFPQHAPLKLLYQSHQDNPIVSAKFTALSCYLGTIASYLALRSDPINEGTSLKEHPIMETLLATRQAWKDIAETEIDTAGLYREKARQVTEDVAPPTKVRKQMTIRRKPTARNVEVEDDISDLDFETGYQSQVKHKPSKKVTADDLLDSIDSEDRAAKKNSLRFYTSRIDQTSKKRDRASKMSGDMDLPYRERNKEAHARKNIEAQRRANKGGDDLDMEDYDVNDMRQAAEARDDLDTYSTLASQSKQKKAEKKATHDEVRDMMKQGYTEEEIAQNGKRGINRQIEKNKGLMPKRNKDQRNPRVKKRKKYEKAKKKLGSKKAIYKPDSGPYKGEMSGISSRVVKSVRFQ